MPLSPPRPDPPPGAGASLTSPVREAHASRESEVWRRGLGLLWLSQVVSHVGDSLFLVGVFFLALEVTGSKSASGLLVAMNFLPALALGLFAGAFVDRYDRRRVMIAADLLRAAAVGAIPVLYLLGHLSAAALGIALFALATGTTVFNPAIKALIPEIAPRPQLTTAVSLFQVSEYVALVVGPALAALALPHLGIVHLFTLDAVTFVFSAVCLLLLPAEARRHMHRSVLLGSRPALGVVWAGVWRDVGAGVEVVRRDPILRALLLLAAFDNLVTMGLTHVVTPLLVKETLGLGPAAYASAQTFFFGGLAAASAAVWLFARHRPKGRLILIGMVLDGLTFIPLAFCQTLAQVQVALFLHAIAIPLMIIPRTVLIQQTVPGPLHGRAFALLNVTVFGMTALSVAATGLLAERVPSQVLFLALGFAGVLPGLIGFASGALRAAR